MVQVRITPEGDGRLIFGRVRAAGDIVSLRSDNAAYLMEMGWAEPIPDPTPIKKPRRSPTTPEAA